MSLGKQVSRRSVLLTAGALLVVSAARCERLPEAAAPPQQPAPQRGVEKEAAIFELSFQVESSYRPFDLVPSAFQAVSVTEETEAGDIVLGKGSPQAPFAAVALTVAPGTDGVVVAGLATGSDEHLMAFCDRHGQQAGIELRRDGVTHLLGEVPARLPETFGLCFTLCENQVTVLVDTGSGWQPLVTERKGVMKEVDLRVPETLAAHRYAWGARPDSGTVRVSDVRAGLFGMTGLRDQHLVQHADGTPYMVDGHVYLTATCAGLGFFQQAHWAVFRLDLADPGWLEPVSKLFFLRDGLLLGDHAGQLVRDDERDRWIVATSSWGDFDFDGIHVRHTETTADLLTGVHVLETQRTPLPTAMGSWDPGLTRIEGRWYVSFVQSPSQRPFDFHPALAVGPAGAAWHEGLELVGAATALHQCEGPILARVDGSWWLLASDGDNRHYPVFDLRMRRVGRLDAPYPTNIPHPQLVPLDDGDHLLVTFDGTQFAEPVMGYGGHGDVVVMRSAGRSR